MRNLIDSSVWVALFLDFDTQHQRAQKVFDGLSGKVYLPYCVVSEVTTILAYKHSKEQSNRFIEFVGDNKDIMLVDNVLSEELKYYTSVSARISFTDAALLYLRQKLKAKLITFDKQLERLAWNKVNKKSLTIW